MSAKKHRLDLMLVEKGWFASRLRARAMIMAGKIFVNGQRVDQPGFSVSSSDTIESQDRDLA